ncbi:hypothetical protein [Paenibacillus sp. Y412MC10]|uniref:AbiTii domain-containing protein n=1 Tax=Geobacillus sp. (strain Y412MC10) TaxID=481743 RepID=UPI001642CE6D|nr:hypothetical protein [Paenibacillus sp. Y412MC10]
MTSLVVELQRDALDSKVSIADLIKKAYVVARKLNISEFQEWLHNEMHGYTDVDAIPDYRNIKGQAQFHNPHYGWRPVGFEDSKIEKLFSTRRVGQTITEIESACKNSKGTLEMKYPFENEQLLQQSCPFPTVFRMHISTPQAEQILHAVRNIILEWSLKLEEDGITGEGMSFSMTEKETAKAHSYNIYNIIENMNQSQIQQATTGSEQTLDITNYNSDSLIKFVETCDENLDKLNLASDIEKEVKQELEKIKQEAKSDKPDHGVIKKGLVLIKKTLGGVGTNLIASGLIHEMSKLDLPYL